MCMRSLGDPSIGAVAGTMSIVPHGRHEYHFRMPHRRLLAGLLVTLSLIGMMTIASQSSSDLSVTARIVWGLFLTGAPIILVFLVLIGWSWTAMASVMYGTIGLALDLATATSLFGRTAFSGQQLMEVILSGGFNLALIVVSSHAFVQALPRGFPPPNPRSPSSSDAA